MRRKITVTKEDIVTAAVKHGGGGGTYCAVALAASRAFGGKRAVVCGTLTVDGVIYKLSRRVLKFVEEFDHNFNKAKWRRAVKGFSFVVRG